MNFSVFFCLGLLTSLPLFASAKRKRDPALRQSFLKSAAFRNNVVNTMQTYNDADVFCKRKHGLDRFFASTDNCERCDLECSYPFQNVTHTCMNKCEGYMINKNLLENLNEAKKRIQTLEDWKIEMGKQRAADKKIFILVMIAVVVVAAIFAVCGVRYGRWLQNHCAKTYAPRPPQQEQPVDDKAPEEDDQRFLDPGYDGSGAMLNV